MRFSHFAQRVEVAQLALGEQGLPGIVAVRFAGIVEDIPAAFPAAPELHLVRIVDGRFHTKAAMFRGACAVLGEKVQVAGRIPLTQSGP